MKAKRFPNVLEQFSEAEKRILIFEAPEDLVYFDGHFDEAAILPGVVQLTWAEHYGREYYKFTETFSHLEAIKFQNVITPSDRVTLTLSYDDEKRLLHFRYESSAGRHSSGRFAFV